MPTDPEHRDAADQARDTAAGYEHTLEYASAFFMGKADSQRAARRLSERLRDLADAVDLIRCIGLEKDHGQQLDAYVREKYEELWGLAQHADDV